MPAATAPSDPLDRDHLARLVGHASELRRALTVVAERIASRRSDAAQTQRSPPTQERKKEAPGCCGPRPRVAVPPQNLSSGHNDPLLGATGMESGFRPDSDGRSGRLNPRRLSGTFSRTESPGL